MKVEFKDTFFESLEKLAWYDTKLWKVWEFFRRGLPTFFKNIYRFRKELYNHQWWDYRYTLEILHRSLVIMEKEISVKGMEEDISRNKKVAKMQRAIQLLKNRLDDNYVEQAEEKLGELHQSPFEFELTEDGLYRLKDNETKEQTIHNRKVFKLAQTIDDKEWEELWNIFKGQNRNQYKKLLKEKTPEEMLKHNFWNDWFDGSDMRGWWD